MERSHANSSFSSIPTPSHSFQTTTLSVPEQQKLQQSLDKSTPPSSLRKPVRQFTHSRVPSETSARTAWTAESINTTLTNFPRPPSLLPSSNPSTPRGPSPPRMGPPSPLLLPGSTTPRIPSPASVPPASPKPESARSVDSSMLFEPGFLATLFDPLRSPTTTRPPRIPSPRPPAPPQELLRSSRQNSPTNLHPGDPLDSIPITLDTGDGPRSPNTVRRLSRDANPATVLPRLDTDTTPQSATTTDSHTHSDSLSDSAAVGRAVVHTIPSAVGIAQATYISPGSSPPDHESVLDSAGKKLRRPAADNLSKLKIINEKANAPPRALPVQDYGSASSPFSPFPTKSQALAMSTASAPLPSAYLNSPNDSSHGLLLEDTERQPTPKRASVPVSVKSRVSSVFSRRTKSIRSGKPSARDSVQPPLPPIPYGIEYQQYDFNPPPDRSRFAEEPMYEAQESVANGSGSGYTHEKGLSRSRSQKSSRSVFTMWSDIRSRRWVAPNDGTFARLKHSVGYGNLDDERLGSPSKDDRRSRLTAGKSWYEMTEAQRLRASVYPGSERKWGMTSTWRKRVIWLGVLLLIAITLAAILAAALLTKHHKEDPQPATPTPAPGCAGNTTGVRCDLDASCVCTAAGASCAPLSQTIVSLAPYTSQLFSIPQIDPHNLSLTLWDLQGSPVKDCSAQALLVDVGASLNSSTSPVRTLFARATILYTLLATDSLERTKTLRTFVSALNFTQLGTADGAVPSTTGVDTSAFIFQDSTFIYNFATLNFTVPPFNSSANTSSLSPSATGTGPGFSLPSSVGVPPLVSASTMISLPTPATVTVTSVQNAPGNAPTSPAAAPPASPTSSKSASVSASASASSSATVKGHRRQINHHHS